MKNNKKILIVGAGPGGLTAGMLLAHRGFEVHIFEKEEKPGGRNSFFEINGFKFDIGPTFLMLKSIYLGMSPWSCPVAFMIIPFIGNLSGI